MKKSNTVTQKMKRGKGRPPTGMMPILGARVPAQLRLQIKKWATQNDLSYSEGVRKLLEAGLESMQSKKGEH
jgi:hypothetical protein